MRYRIKLTPSEEGYAAAVIGLPGCHSQGDTEDEALRNISVAIQEYLEVARSLDSGQIVREIEVEA
jgi:predicted RNase H-like HicB family nuclease